MAEHSHLIRKIVKEARKYVGYPSKTFGQVGDKWYTKKKVDKCP